VPYRTERESLGDAGERTIMLHSCSLPGDGSSERPQLFGYRGQWYWREDFGHEEPITFCPWCAVRLRRSKSDP